MEFLVIVSGKKETFFFFFLISVEYGCHGTKIPVIQYQLNFTVLDTNFGTIAKTIENI